MRKIGFILVLAAIVSSCTGSLKPTCKCECECPNSAEQAKSEGENKKGSINIKADFLTDDTNIQDILGDR